MTPSPLGQGSGTNPLAPSLASVRREGRGIPIDIPGLSQLLPQISSGSLVVVESQADPAKHFFLRKLVLSALRAGFSISYFTSRDREELGRLLDEDSSAFPIQEYSESLHVEEADAIGEESTLGEGSDVVFVDSFSFLTLDLSPQQLAHVMRGLRRRCRREQATVVLSTNRGIADTRAEAITLHLADGMIQFQSREGPEGPQHFLRIPKWMSSTNIDQNIHYTFDGRRMAIDLRKRVL